MLRNILNIIFREIKMLTGDRDLFIIVFIVPVLYGFFFASIYIYKAEKNIPVAVVDLDKSEFSEDFIQRITANGMLSVVYSTGNLEVAKSKLLSMDYHGIVYIPHESESNLKSGKSINIVLYLNTTRFLISNDINKTVNEASLAFNDERKKLHIQSLGYNSDEANDIIDPVRSEVHPMFNTTETYGDYLIPGLLALILHQTLFIGVSECIAAEREKKSLQNLKNVSGNSVFTAITGKTLLYLLLFTAYSLFFFAFTFPAFKIQLAGSIPALILITSLMILSVIFMSIFVSSFFKKKHTALLLIAFTTYPLFFISGYVFPSYALPEPLAYMSKIFPITPFLSAFTRITQYGAGFENIHKELINISLIAMGMFLIAWYRIKSLFKSDNQN